MKLKYLVAPLLFAAAAVTGCQETAETYPAIYMTDAQSNPDKSMTIDEPPAETSITVSASVVAEHDIHIQLEVRPDLLAAYNDKYGKNYQIPPADSYSLSSTEATILAGYNTSSEIGFTVTSVSEFAEGVTYCVPVSIKTVSGGMTVLEPSRTLFIVLKTPVISKAIYLGSSNIYKVTSFQENSDLAALPQLTLEARVYMLGFQTRDPYISSIMGIEGICGVRFGDVKVDPDCIQICHDSYQPAATDKPFDKEKWYHVAAVWTGSSWDIYINGQYATGVETQGETIDLTSDNSGGFYLGASYGGGRTLNGYVAECRVWTRALSQSEIANNMNYVDPTSDGLLAYWRMNAWVPNDSGSGNIVRDLTGHGYDAVGGSSNPTMMDTKWN
ncbi:DUF1735 and LamG domain-containing protein [Alistipes onderdonkii]|uniref:DUF1735 and LamG domain-containing protein n=1 Tax=Alistipes onderdonkii TaxID=328813 RepID=UPI0036F34A69